MSFKFANALMHILHMITHMQILLIIRKYASLILVFLAHFYNIGKVIACAYLSHGVA